MYTYYAGTGTCFSENAIYDVLDYQTWAEQLGHSVEEYSN